MSHPDPNAASAPRGVVTRLLDGVERIGNKLPDPAMLFLILMLVTWVVAAVMSGWTFSEIDPRTGDPVTVANLLSGESLTVFLASLVQTFGNFAPPGVVLVAMLGLGVAEHTGFINALLRAILSVTPKMLLTPALIGVGVLSHIAVDAGYVLVIPLGAVIFYAAGRHPLAGIAAAFAGVSGGFSATFFVPSSLDPMLAGLTQEAARILDPGMEINPLNNYFFTTASTFLVKIGRASCRDRRYSPGGAGRGRRRHTRWPRDWSSDVCSSDLLQASRRRSPASRAGFRRRSSCHRAWIRCSPASPRRRRGSWIRAWKSTRSTTTSSPPPRPSW